MKKNAGNDDRFRREASSSGKPYFVLIAGNNEPLGRSEMYERAQSREKGVKAVKRVAASAPGDDLT